MNIQSTTSILNQVAGRVPVVSQRIGEDFESQLRTASAEGAAPDQLRDAAVKLVSSSLVLPALASLHQSPLRPTSGPFAEGTIEKRFGPLLDAQLSDRVTKASKFGLVDSIVKRFASHSHGNKAS